MNGVPTPQLDFPQFHEVSEPKCDKCGEPIDLETRESYHVVYWRCYGRDLYTHIACF